MLRNRRSTPVRSLLLGSTFFASLLGCGGDDRPANALTDSGSVPYPGCTSEFFGTCDYSTALCQDAVFAAVACVREAGDVTMPPVEEWTVDEFADALQADYAEDPDALALSSAWDRAAVLVGLAEAGDVDAESEVDVYVDSVPAFYSPEGKRVVIITGAEEDDPDAEYWSTLTLAHEFVHAMQDQEHDLMAIQTEHEVSYDSYLATRAAVEGEATMVESFYDAALSGYAQSRIDFRAYYMSYQDAAEDYFDGTSPLLSAPRIFPYGYGARYVYNVFEADGMAGVRDLESYLPASTLDVIASETSVVSTQLPAPFSSAIAPPVGNTFTDDDVLGAWLLSRLGYVQDVSGLVDPLIRDWRRDHLALYLSDAGDVTVLWRIELASEESASSLSNVLEAGSWYPDDSIHGVNTSATVVNLVVSDLADSLPDWMTAIEAGETIELEATSDDTAQAARPRPLGLTELVRRHVARNRWMH